MTAVKLTNSVSVTSLVVLSGLLKWVHANPPDGLPNSIQNVIWVLLIVSIILLIRRLILIGKVKQQNNTNIEKREPPPSSTDSPPKHNRGNRRARIKHNKNRKK